MAHVIDKDRLPDCFPTHRHEAGFWEELGRTVATFGFLEEVLGKAIFAFTGTRHYSEDEVLEAYERLCCTNQERDSLRESSMIAGQHEQLAPTKYKTDNWSFYNDALRR